MRATSVARVMVGLAVVAAATLTMVAVQAPAPQAATPIVRAAFYYPWYPGAWTQHGVTPYTNYTPSDGYYSSNDPTIIKQQIASMQYGHLDAGIISWWGQGSQEDAVVPSDLAAADGTGFKWSLYYEPEGYGDPSAAQIQSDLTYIKAKYAGNPNYLTIDGEPVIFVYADPNDSCGMAQRWSQANAAEGFYTVLKVFSGYTSCGADASAWHQYAPAGAEDHQQGYSFSVSPGFYKSGEAAPRLARNVAAWAQDVNDMVASKEPLQLVTTFNEWGEGSAVESAAQWASPSGYGSYLDVLHNEIPAPPPASTGQGGTTTTTGGAGTGSGPSTTATISVPAQAATYVQAGLPAANYDGVTPLRDSFRAYRTLLQFATDIPAGSTIVSASLTIDPLVTRSGTFQVHPSANFDPTTVTWADRPVRDATVLGTSDPPTAGAELTIPLDGLAPSALTNLALTFSTPGLIESINGAGTANPPILTITTAAPDSPSGTGGQGATPGAPPTTMPPTTMPPTTTIPTTTTATTTTPTGTPNAYCGTRTGAPTTSKLMVIYEENHGLSSITSSSAPHISSLASSCALATNYQALTHPSLPNYLASTSGLSYASSPWTSDCDPTSAACTTANDNIFNQVGVGGWRSYAESMTSNCQRNSSGNYATKHNPAAYYTDLGAACPVSDVPLGTPTAGNLLNDVVNGALPTVSTVTPNLVDDMHDGTIAQGDAWLAQWIPEIVAGPDYQSGQLTIVILWDEGSGSGNVASVVPAIVISPFVTPGSTTSTLLTHYSLLRSEEEVAGVPLLGLASSATSLRSAFGF